MKRKILAQWSSFRGKFKIVLTYSFLFCNGYNFRWVWTFSIRICIFLSGGYSGTTYLPQGFSIDGMPILDPKGVLFGWIAAYSRLGRACHSSRQRFLKPLNSQRKCSWIVPQSYEVVSSSQAAVQHAASPVTACSQSHSAFFRHFKNRRLLCPKTMSLASHILLSNRLKWTFPDCYKV